MKGNKGGKIFCEKFPCLDLDYGNFSEEGDGSLSWSCERCNLNHKLLEEAKRFNYLDWDVLSEIKSLRQRKVPEHLISQVKNYLKDIQGIKHTAEVLTIREREEILRREMEREKRVLKGITSSYNLGLRKCLTRDVLLILSHDSSFREPCMPTVILVNDKEIRGHEIVREENLKRFALNEEKYAFLGRRFVVYNERSIFKELTPHNSLFVFPPVPFPELENFRGVVDVVSGSPNFEADTYIRTVLLPNLNIPKKLGLILVGFNHSPCVLF
ncbi:MAG: hypothetical protein ACETVN_03070 [Asgard group archaeon]